MRENTIPTIIAAVLALVGVIIALVTGTSPSAQQPTSAESSSSPGVVTVPADATPVDDDDVFATQVVGHTWYAKFAPEVTLTITQSQETPPYEDFGVSDYVMNVRDCNPNLVYLRRGDDGHFTAVVGPQTKMGCSDTPDLFTGLNRSDSVRFLLQGDTLYITSGTTVEAFTKLPSGRKG